MEIVQYTMDCHYIKVRSFSDLFYCWSSVEHRPLYTDKYIYISIVLKTQFFFCCNEIKGNYMIYTETVAKAVY